MSLRISDLHDQLSLTSLLFLRFAVWRNVRFDILHVINNYNNLQA